ncbi:MAG: carboxylesterase/lipase family protein [Promethearchaeota archaeon]
MNKTDIIETKSGKVQGYIRDGIQIFKGIPYAASPVGSLRFSPPAEREPWSNTYDATKYGPYVYQGYTPLEALFGKPGWESEKDCLTLNIWTPNTDNGKRPVMVWIHGGAFIMGGGANPIYDGLALAKRGNVVTVTVNYRLGSLGFLNTTGVTANIGMLDQIAALKWIRENIETFGGDPNNITIFGESAGGISVITLMAMPAAKGLFHRVIAQSAPILMPKPAKSSSKNLFQKLGIEEGDIDALRKVPPEKIIDAQNKVLAKAEKENASELMDFRPSIDGNTLPKHPLDALRNGSGKNIDLLIGCNKDEYKLFTGLNPRFKKIKEETFPRLVSALLSRMDIDESKSLEILNVYQDTMKDMASTNPIEIFDAIGTDFLFRIAEIRFAEAHQIHNSNVFNYLFTWPSPAFKGRLGSCHAMELPFVFGTLDIPKADLFFGKGPEAINLSEKMMDSWIAFAHTGNPNHESIPEWPIYNRENRKTMVCGKEFKVVERYLDKERAAWDNIL